MRTGLQSGEERLLGAGGEDLRRQRQTRQQFLQDFEVQLGIDVVEQQERCSVRTAPDMRQGRELEEGLELLLSRVDQVLTKSAGSAVVDMPVLTRSRHIHGIHQARAEIAAFSEAWDDNALPAPVTAVHLRAAITALESLVGAISTDDVLDRVFSSFCVGK